MTPPSALDMTLPAFTAERRRACSTTLAARPQLSIDICCPQGAQQQTRRPPLLLLIDGTDRQTDGHKPDRYIDRAAGACVLGCSTST